METNCKHGNITGPHKINTLSLLAILYSSNNLENIQQVTRKVAKSEAQVQIPGAVLTCIHQPPTPSPRPAAYLAPANGNLHLFKYNRFVFEQPHEKATSIDRFMTNDETLGSMRPLAGLPDGRGEAGPHGDEWREREGETPALTTH